MIRWSSRGPTHNPLKAIIFHFIDIIINAHTNIITFKIIIFFVSHDFLRLQDKYKYMVYVIGSIISGMPVAHGCYTITSESLLIRVLIQVRLI